MPFLSFPEPGGRFGVGQCDVFWKDPSNPEMKLMVRIFYPVDKEKTSGLSNAAWLPDTFGANTVSYAEAYAKFMWRPGINALLIGTLGFLPLMSNVRTRTYAEAPLTDILESFRPLIYSHGLGGSRSCYSGVCVDLASHGFVVFALEHTDGSASLSVMSDGTVIEHSHVPPLAIIPVKQKRIPGGFTRSLVPKIQPQPMTQYEFRNKQLVQRGAETSFLADCIEKISQGDLAELPLPAQLSGRLPGRVDMSKLCAVGHSFGAATCITACQQDRRFQACVAHDAWLFPLSEAVATGALRVPTLFLNADTFDMLWPEEGNKLLYALTKRSLAKQVSVKAFGVVGTKHQNYSDFPVIAPELTGAMGVRGDTDADEALGTITACTASFLDFHLSSPTLPTSPSASTRAAAPPALPSDGVPTGLAAAAAHPAAAAAAQQRAEWRVPQELEGKLTAYDASRWGAATAGDAAADPDSGEVEVLVKIGAFTNDKSYVPPSITKV